MNRFDVIVIGAGHNGLTTAAMLAKKGRQVLVVEKRDIIGGIAAGEQFQAGHHSVGLLHDTSGVRNSVIRELQLEKYGLKTTGQRSPYALLSKNGEGITITSDAQATSQQIAKFSQKDADAYMEYSVFINKISPFINGLMNEVPPNITNITDRELLKLAKKGWSLRKLGKKTMLEFLHVAPMCIADFLNERFETDFIKAGIGAPALYGGFVGPWSAGTALNLLIRECTANQQVLGGPAALVTALEKAAKSNGVEIRTNAEVARIKLDNGRVDGVELKGGEVIEASKVATSCSPFETFLSLIVPNEINYKLEHGITHFRARGTTAKVNLALSQPLQFKCDFENIKFARTGNSFDEMEKAFDAIKYRQFSEEPILDIHISENTASVLVHFAPYDLEGGWNPEQNEKLYQNVIRSLEQYCSNASEAITGKEILSPLDLEQRYNLPNGNIYHGEHAIDQLITRPIPSCMQYRTPIQGLYLCGSGSHPGGGITCAPGYLAASVIMS
ncbi:MAG: hypothetical protein COA57_04515 [Flavobacteriales bacterium]|nr:MAG: hypothetical protein COA57_04515 [Flavobacteriales bacterium]